VTVVSPLSPHLVRLVRSAPQSGRTANVKSILLPELCALEDDAVLVVGGG
jgi:hypothetical protein